MRRPFAVLLASLAVAAPARGDLLEVEQTASRLRARVKADGGVFDVETKLTRPQKPTPGAALFLDMEAGEDLAAAALARGMTVAAPDLATVPAGARAEALRDLLARLRAASGAKRLLARGKGENAAALLEAGTLFDGLLLQDAAAVLAGPPAKGPRIVATWGSDAYWRATPPPIPSGREPDNRRSFFLTGTAPTVAGENCAAPANGRAAGPALRALLVALDEWTKGTKPPASRAPGPADVAAASDLGWPSIPGLPARPAGDRRVPRIDADGNETSGLRLPDQALPLATFLGFNARRDTDGPDCDAGAALPFAPTRAEREKSGDTRPSLVERYGSRAYFVATMRVLADKLVKERLLLKEDADAYVAAAKTAPF